MSKQLAESSFEGAHFARAEWVATTELGTPFEAVLDPGYWCHIAKRLRPWHRIEVRAGDQSYLAELLVVSAGPMWAHVAVLQHYEIAALPRSTSPVGAAVELRVEFTKGSKWRVLRGKDELVRGLDTKDDAELWIKKSTGQSAAA